MSEGKKIENMHDANLELQGAADDYSVAVRGRVTGKTFVFAGAGAAKSPAWITIHAGGSGTPLVVDGEEQSRVQVDPRTLRVGNARRLGHSLKGLAATLDFAAEGLCTLHEEGALPVGKCRHGIPRSEASSAKAKVKFDIRPTMESQGVTARKNKASQVVGFNPIDPTCPHLAEFANRLKAIAKQCHGLTMKDDSGKEISIAAYTDILVANVVADSEKRSKAAKKGKAKASESGDSSNEVTVGDTDNLSGAFGERVIASFVTANGRDPENAGEVMEFVSEACEFYAASLAEGATRAEDKAQAV